MEKFIVHREDAKLIESIMEWRESVYSLKLKTYDDTIWCDSISDLYFALSQFKKYGEVITDEFTGVIR